MNLKNPVFLFFFAFPFWICQPSSPALTGEQEDLLLKVLQAQSEIHEKLLKEDKIPDLTEIRASLQALAGSSHPGLVELSQSLEKEWKLEQTDLDTFYTNLSSFSAKMEPWIKSSPKFQDYFAFYCPMVDKKWVGKGPAVRNPYAPEMRDCGDRIP